MTQEPQTPQTPPALTPVPTIPPAAPPPPAAQFVSPNPGSGSPSPVPGMDWKHVGTAIGAAIAIVGGLVSTFQTGSATKSATEATQAQYVTVENARAFRDKLFEIESHANGNERRIATLEKELALQQVQIKDLTVRLALATDRTKSERPEPLHP
jgi:uncharacterized coiled-coil protein SlyX